MLFADTGPPPLTGAEIVVRPLFLLAEDRVKKEILYREALALGLDQDDLVIRRRLRQKMEFLNTDLTNPGPPSEAELQAYLEANMDRFRSTERLSFTHVYLKARRPPSL